MNDIDSQCGLRDSSRDMLTEQFGPPLLSHLDFPRAQNRVHAFYLSLFGMMRLNSHQVKRPTSLLLQDKAKRILQFMTIHLHVDS